MCFLTVANAHSTSEGHVPKKRGWRLSMILITVFGLIVLGRDIGMIANHVSFEAEGGIPFLMPAAIAAFGVIVHGAIRHDEKKGTESPPTNRQT